MAETSPLNVRTKKREEKRGVREGRREEEKSYRWNQRHSHAGTGQLALLRPLRELLSNDASMDSKVKLERSHLRGMKRFGSLADPHGEREEGLASVGDLEKLLFEGKLRRAGMRDLSNSLDQMQLMAVARSKRDTSSHSPRELPNYKYKKIKRKPQQFYNLGVVDKNMELLNRALPSFIN